MDEASVLRRLRMERLARQISNDSWELLAIVRRDGGLTNIARLDILRAASRMNLIQEEGVEKREAS